MSLTAADVAEIMRILEGSSFDEVVLEIDGLKLSMRRGSVTEARLDGEVLAASAAPASARTNASPAAAPASARTTASAPAAPASARTNASPLAASASTSSPAASGPRPTPVATTDPTVQEVTSPLLGTCYRAPKPGAPPFVEVGTVVEEETVVAIVEVMKLMNTVRAGVKGTVSDILMRDGALVEYGETLLRIKKAG